MNTSFTLDEMILQYSECPFIDEKIVTLPALTDQQQKRKVLSRLLIIASNIFNKVPQPE
jgi:hypothetical protein